MDLWMLLANRKPENMETTASPFCITSEIAGRDSALTKDVYADSVLTDLNLCGSSCS
jgi:hypothetical protein